MHINIIQFYSQNYHHHDGDDGDDDGDVSRKDLLTFVDDICLYNSYSFVYYNDYCINDVYIDSND